MDSISGMGQYVGGNDEPLTSENYNEVDALVFAEVSYFRFEDMYTDYQNQEVSLQQYAKDVLDYSANQESSSMLSSDQYTLFKNISTSDRYKDCTVNHFDAENDSSQWAAMTIDTNDGSGTSIIAMRGTDGTTLGWTEDFELLYDTDGTNAQNEALQYLLNCNADNIYMTGHSKGGNDVTTAYVMAPENVRDRVLHLDNFDGPGVNDEIKNTYADAYSELGDKLDNYYPQDSAIGLLLNDNPGNTHFVQSNVREDYKDKWILGEHDPYSFQVDGNGFEAAEQSGLSDWLNKTLDDTVGTLTNDERRNLISMMNKLGIPSLIAGKDDNPFADNGETAKAAIDLIDVFGIVPENVKEKLAVPVKIALNIYEGAKIFIQSSLAEKAALIKTAGAFICYGAYEFIKDKVEQFISSVEKKLVNIYNKLADWASDRLKDIAEGLRNLADGIVNAVDKCRGQVVSIIRNIKNRVGAVLSGGGHADFSVNTAALISSAEQLNKISNDLTEVLASIEKVQSNLNFSAALCNMGAFLHVKQSVREACKCSKEMGKTIKEIGNQYQTAEKKVVSY